MNQRPEILLTVPWGLSVNPDKIKRLKPYVLKLPRLGGLPAQEAAARLLMPSLQLGHWYGLRLEDIMSTAQGEYAQRIAVRSHVHRTGTGWIPESLDLLDKLGYVTKLRDFVVAYAPTQALIDILPRNQPHNQRRKR